MKALLLSEPSVPRVVDPPEPELADVQILVRVAACGICGSDVQVNLCDNRMVLGVSCGDYRRHSRHGEKRG